MNKSDWDELKQILSGGMGSHAVLAVDVYKLKLVVMPRDTLKNVIYIQVYGANMYRCCNEDCEIRRRFYQAHKHTLLRANEKKKLKREKKDVRTEVEKLTTYYSYLPQWTSFNAMKAHFIKNNKEISLLTEGGVM